MLLAEKSAEIFHKHKGYFFISESFALNWYTFVALTNKMLLFLLYCKLKQNFLFYIEKLTEYWTSAVNVASSNPCVGPFPGIKITFFLLSISTGELISTP